MKIYLVGYMGSGKSTLGHELADAFGIGWIDLDEEFELQYKISISDFFGKYGEKHFRELEHKLLTKLLLIPDLVVSTGGGTPCYHGNMELMNQNGLTMYLAGSPEMLLKRIILSARKRPVFLQMQGDDSLQKLTQHVKSREEYYKQAKITIDAIQPDIEEIKSLIHLHTDKST